MDNKERIESEIAHLANQFAGVYVTLGLKDGHVALMEIMSQAMKYEKRVVISMFRKALLANGVKSVEGLPV